MGIEGMRGSRIAGCFAVTVALLATAMGVRGQTASYQDFEGLTSELRALVNASDMATMRSLGTSHEGREIWMVEIGNPSGTPLAERPAVLVVGNLEGDHLLGSALALETVRYLVTGDGGEEDLTGLLNEQVIYVLPRLNPDGAEALLDNVRQARTRNARPYDDDNDGRIDEDPAEDLDGNGMITVMRVPDPSGDYMIDPDDPRLMKRADASKGESGEYAIYWEGVDSDGDGFINEDGPGGVDLNRNFQHEYPYWERDAGPHMVSEPETRALMDFMTAHRNIGAILTFGHSDNLVTAPDGGGKLAGASTLELSAFADASNSDIFDVGVFRSGGGGRGRFGGFGGRGGRAGPRLRGAQPGSDNDPGSGRRPATTVNTRDLEYFEAVSKAYREITGIEKIGINRVAKGAFFQFGYFQFGVPSFSTQGWGLPEAVEVEDDDGEDNDSEDAAGKDDDPRSDTEERPEPGRSARARGPQARGSGGGRGDGAEGSGTDAKILKAMDAGGIDVFVDWQPYTHPDLGEVEIGGFRPYAVTNPPVGQLPDLGRSHGEFVVHLASLLPRVSIVNTEVTSHGNGLFTVSAEIENSGYFPTALQHGVVSRSVQPTTVQIQVPTEAVLTGSAKTSTIQKLDGSGSRERFTWVIRGQAGTSVEIRVRSQKGGSDTATVTLR